MLSQEESIQTAGASVRREETPDGHAERSRRVDRAEGGQPFLLWLCLIVVSRSTLTARRPLWKRSSSVPGNAAWTCASLSLTSCVWQGRRLSRSQRRQPRRRDRRSAVRDLTAEESIEYDASLFCPCPLCPKAEDTGAYRDVVCPCAAFWCRQAVGEVAARGSSGALQRCR